METRRSKRKEAAATDPTPSEPRNKKPRRTNAESKSKAVSNRKPKAQIAVASAPAEPSTAQAAEGPVPKASLDSAPAIAPSVTAEVPETKAQEPHASNAEEAAAAKAMASRKEASEAQERAAMEQERRAAELFGTAQGAGLGGLFGRYGESMAGPLSSSTLKGIMASLKEDDEMVQEAALNELTELMSMSSEEALTVLPLEQLVPQLISLLNAEHNSQLMLLGARNLTLLADVLPTICSSIVRHGAVPALCARLMTIEYIDLAEQSLQALEKISHEHPAACLRHGGLLASLSYLDFFQTGVQRVAVATAANMCRCVTSEHTDAVASAVPMLTNLLQYQDAKVVDNACLALSRIAEAFAHKPASLNQLCQHGLINNAVQLISVSDTGSMTSQLSVSTYYGLIKLLSTCVSGSHTVAEELLQSGISSTLHKLLRSSSLLSTATASSVLRSSDQLHEVVKLACELLPSLPDATTIMLNNATTAKQLEKDCEGLEKKGNDASKEGCLHARYLQEHPEVLKIFTSDLLSLLLQIYGSTVAEKVRSQCLGTITKILHFGTPDNFGEQLNDLPISSFIASLLAQHDSTIAAKALQLAEILMHKLPSVFSKYFLKEGVVHAVQQLAATAPKPAVEEKKEKAQGKAAKRASQRLKNKDKEEAKAAANDAPAPSDKPSQPEPAPAAPASPKPTPAQTLQVATALHAQQFFKQYFTGANSPSGTQTDGTRQLRSICSQLSAPGKVQELLSVLQDQDVANISTFEFLTSGAVQQLKDYLTGADLLKGKGKAYVDSHKLLQRLHAFCEAASSQGRHGVAPMHSLVGKLQSVFASAEAFPVSEAAPPRPSGLRFASGHPFGALRGYRSSSSTGDGSSLSSGLAALTQPFKLRLARAEHEKQLKDYSHNVVLIEPLASMTAVEDFLWSKVYRSSASPPPSRTASGAEEAQPAAAASHATNMATQPAATAAAAVAASDAHKAPSTSNAASTATARPNTRASNKHPPAKSKSQEIPKGKTTSNQRMTRAAAARVAAELADTAPGSMMEEDSDEDEDVAEGPMSEADLPLDMAFGQANQLGGSAAAAAAAFGSSLGSGEQDMEEQADDYDEEMDEEMDDEDEEEELALQQPAVHDVHVGTQTAEPASTSGREGAAAAMARQGLAAYVQRAVAAATATVGTSAGQAIAESILQPTVSRSATAASTSYAQAADATRAGQTKLRFYLAGKLVPSSYTIFQAVQLASRAKQAQEEAQRSSGQAEADAANGPKPVRRLWDDVYTISYSRYENLEEGAQPADSAASGLAQLSISSTPSHSRDPFRESPLAELLFPALPQPMQATSQVQDTLLVLKILEGLNRNGSHVAAYEDGLKGKTDSQKKLTKHHQVTRDEFISHKLAPKLAQQLKDVLAICGNALPSWCSQLVFSCKFLFPFDIRRRYFYCTSFSLARALHHLQQQQNAEGGNAPNTDREVRELRVGRLQRQKVRVSRKNMLLSAEKVMETYASHRAVLELEYFGEVGTGLGPTLEFYTLLSHELQRRGLGMWRADNTNNSAAAAQSTPKKPSAMAADIKATNPDQPSVTGLQPDIALDGQLQQFITAPQGLFPAPIAPHLLTGQGSKSKVLGYFKLMGRAMAKALQDNRLLDLPLSYVFYRKALGQPLDLYDIRKFDAALGGTLEKLYAAHRAHQSSGGGAKKGPLLVDGCPIEDLCLTFVLPGYPEYELQHGGTDTVVDASNVGAYIAAVVDANLESGIKLQLESFRAGFNEVFPLDSLKCFFEDEIEAMMCGTGEKWTIEALTDTIKFDHGYTATSTAIKYFVDILTELDAADQRRFLRFVTGSPRLPPGGIAALHPRLTVVRKHSSLTAEQAASLGSSASPMAGSLGHQGSTSTLSDGDLPSVMTCANYVKLPPYSSKAVMRERLLFAIREGQGSFDLS